MENKYLIYKITNVKNGKMYIGQTKRGLKERWNQHAYNAVNHVHDNHFKRAIRKYGEEAFSKEVLIDGLTLDEANRYEETYVSLFCTFETGYNSTRGGDNMEMTEEVRRKKSEATKGENCYWYGKTKSAETRRKISEALKGEKSPMYGKTKSAETRRKLSEAHKGEKSHMYGKSLSAETRRKISEAHKGEKHPMYGKTHSFEARRKISEAQTKTPVIGVNKTTGEVRSFASTQEAARILRVRPSSVSQASQRNRDKSLSTGVIYSGGNYYWFYKETYSNPNCQLHIECHTQAVDITSSTLSNTTKSKNFLNFFQNLLAYPI